MPTLPALTGYAPTDRLTQMYLGADGSVPTVAYGTQAQPIDYFYGQGGSGNKTTNKDLPQWLRDLGVKGDAYAGGMLKPALRYGFLYKGGKIHFADGTSFDAKKVKDKETKQITYSYTGADGKDATYDPTDEQDTYNKKYQNATANQSFVDKLGATADRTRAHFHDVLEGASDAVRGKGSIFGGNPWATKLSNAVTGRSDKPITDQYGGPTPESQAKYVEEHGGNALGYQPGLHAVGSAIASYYAGNYAVGQLGQLAGGAGGSAGGAGAGGAGAGGSGVASGVGTGTGAGWGGAGTANSGLGVFSNGGNAGLAGVGGGNAGALAAAGTIGGGAGAANGLGSLFGSGGGGSGSGGLGGLGTGGSMPAGATSWTDWIGPVIQAGTAIYSGSQQSGAIKDASAASIAEQRRQFDTVRSDTAPQRALGNAAVGRIAALNGYTTEDGAPDMSQFFESPDYRFNLAESQRAIDRSAAARGGLLSGGAVKEGERYASGLASREYSSFVDRLMQQAGLGSTGIGASAAAGANAANNISATAMNAGNARASIYGNTGANVNNAVQSGMSNYMLRRYLGDTVGG